MKPQIGVFISYKDIAGEPCTFAEFRQRLSQLARDEVIYICSLMNSLLQTWSADSSLDFHRELVTNTFVPGRLRDWLIAMLGNPHESYFVFHRRQLLLVAKEAARVCSNTGTRIMDHPCLRNFGVVLLMANDHLHFGMAEDASATWDLIAEFVPITEYSTRSHLYNRIARARVMISRFYESLRDHPRFIDIRARFAELTGVQHEFFELMGLAIISKYVTMDPEKYRKDNALFRLSRETYVSQSALTREEADACLAEFSGTPEQIANHLTARDNGANDFTCWREFPLFDTGPVMWATDVLFVFEKLETGAFWRVHNAINSPTERQTLHSLWGKAFERYLQWLLRSCSSGLNTFHFSPIYEDTGEEICDAIAICGDEAALLEFKGNTFSAKAKYSGDPKLLKSEIDRKLVGTDDDRKGVLQLAAAVRNLLGKGHQRSVKGIDLSRVRKVFPVLITRDDIGATLLLNKYLAGEFRNNINKKALRSGIVTPLFCLSADEIEQVSAYLASAKLTAILESRYAGDRSMQLPFNAAHKKLLAQLGLVRNPELVKIYDEAMDAAVARLFPPDLERFKVFRQVERDKGKEGL